MPPKKYDPVTPTSKVEFTIPNPVEATPIGLQAYLGEDATNDTRRWVAAVMNSETFLCQIRDFMKDYAPVQVAKDDVVRCKEYLLEQKILQEDGKNDEGDKKYIFAAYRIPPRKRKGKESIVFQDVGTIVKAIFDYAASVSQRGNTFTYLDVPDNNLDASIPGTNHKMDACLVEDPNYKALDPDARLLVNNVMIAKEFKKERDRDNQIQVRQQIVGDCHHTMNDDIRRKFMYGTTMENDRMSVWYFSRSHSVKSISFDWISEDVDIFIEVYLSFAFATPAELGIDPLIHKLSIDKKSTNPWRWTQQYVYECRPETDTATPNATSTRYYMTCQSLSNERPYRISGRSSRVWKAIEVDSPTDAKIIPGAKPVILKDVWVDDYRKSEAENMDLIFGAVDGMVADARRVYPGPDGLRKFIDSDPRFSGFTEATRIRFTNLLTDKQYRSLFLTKRHAWEGETTKALGNVKLPKEPIFSPEKSANPQPGDNVRNTPTMHSKPASDLHPRQSVQEMFAKKLAPTALDEREFGKKRQCRFVYEEVCKSMWEVPTLGDLMEVLRQALDALQVLYSVGWVHRDISNGNILVLPVSEGNTTKWKVKVSDFEFAQAHRHRQASTDPRTGTPYFMPSEILAKSYFIEELRLPKALKAGSFATQLSNLKDHKNPIYKGLQYFEVWKPIEITTLPANATPNIPPQGAVVLHNYHHDLESIWWIVLYYITCGVGYNPSFIYGQTIFHEELQLHPLRRKAFVTNSGVTLPSCLDPRLRAMPAFMEKLRNALYLNCIQRALFGQLDVRESFSQLHGLFAEQFDKLLSGDFGEDDDNGDDSDGCDDEDKDRDDNDGDDSDEDSDDGAWKSAWKSVRVVPLIQSSKNLKRDRSDDDDATALQRIPKSFKSFAGSKP